MESNLFGMEAINGGEVAAELGHVLEPREANKSGKIKETMKNQKYMTKNVSLGRISTVGSLEALHNEEDENLHVSSERQENLVLGGSYGAGEGEDIPLSEGEDHSDPLKSGNVGVPVRSRVAHTGEMVVGKRCGDSGEQYQDMDETYKKTDETNSKMRKKFEKIGEKMGQKCKKVGKNYERISENYQDLPDTYDEIGQNCEKMTENWETRNVNYDKYPVYFEKLTDNYEKLDKNYEENRETDVPEGVLYFMGKIIDGGLSGDNEMYVGDSACGENRPRTYMLLKEVSEKETKSLDARFEARLVSIHPEADEYEDSSHGFPLLVSSSLLSFPCALGIALGFYDMGLLTMGVFLSSINHWRRPRLGWRRNFDIFTVAAASLYHLLVMVSVDFGKSGGSGFTTLSHWCFLLSPYMFWSAHTNPTHIASPVVNPKSILHNSKEGFLTQNSSVNEPNCFIPTLCGVLLHPELFRLVWLIGFVLLGVLYVSGRKAAARGQHALGTILHMGIHLLGGGFNSLFYTVLYQTFFIPH